jgi:DNA (cytosine-5)-methyltransferase 1
MLDDSIFPEPVKSKMTVSDIIDPNEHGNADYSISDIARKNIKNFSYKYKTRSARNDVLAYEIRRSRCQFKTDGIAPCLTAKMGTGGNNVPVIAKHNRRLTENECLRLMGFPKSFIIQKGQQSYKQIGNSVVVPIVDKIAKQIIDRLNGDNQ